MKKLLLSLIMTVGLVSYTQAATTTLVMADVTKTGTNTATSPDVVYNPLETFTSGTFTAKFEKNGSNNATCYYATTDKRQDANDVRLYAKNKMQFTTTGESMTQITFKIPASGHGQLSDLMPSTGTCTVTAGNATDWTVVWTGDATDITFELDTPNTYGNNESKTAGQLRFTEMEIVSGGAATPATEVPVFNPEGGVFTETVSVELTAAEGAKIYYTTNGTNPTENSDLYEFPIVLTQTTTIKAIAIEQGKQASRIVSQEYVIRKGTFSKTAVLDNLTIDNEYHVQGIVTGLCTRGFILTDNAGSVLVYQAADFDPAKYQIGSQVELQGKLTAYGNGFQFDTKNCTIIDWDNETYTLPAAKKLTAADLDAEIARTENKKAEYVSLTGKVAISGNYCNLIVEGAQGQGSIYFVIPEIKAQLIADAEATIEGWAVSTSGNPAKYLNIVTTKVTTDQAPETTEVATLAEFIQKASTSTVKYTGTATVEHQNQFNLYLQDQTAAILVYFEKGTTYPTYTEGDQITGFQGIYDCFNGTHEMKVNIANAATFAQATQKGEATIKTLDIENITPEHQSQLVMVENVKIDTENTKLIDEIDAEIGYYNKFAIDITADPAKTYNVKAIVSYYHTDAEDKVELYPISITDQESVQTIENNTIDLNKAEIYTTTGARIAADNLTNGIYIVRQGNKTMKIVIRK